MTKRVKDERDYCTSCGKKWIDHYGIIFICQRLQEVLNGLDRMKSIIEYGNGHNKLDVINGIIEELLDSDEETMK